MAYTWPTPPLGSVILVTLRSSYENQRLLNTYHFRLDGNANNRTIEGISNQMNTWFGTVGTGLYDTLKAMYDTNCSLADAQIQFIRPARYVPIGYALNKNGDVVDGQLGVELPNVAAVLTRRAVVATRRGVSSLHVCMGVSETTVVNGKLEAAFITKMQAHGNAILNSTNIGDGITLTPVIYHRGATPETDPIGSFIVQDTVRVMRRRTVGLGI